jgi:hypothetical protein
MRDAKHYRRLLDQNPNASVGFTLAAAAVYAAKYGTCEPADHGTGNWKSIARDLKLRYGEQLSADAVRDEMDRTAGDIDDSDDRRSSTLPPVRVTDDEREKIKTAARTADLSIGAYIRQKLGL